MSEFAGRRGRKAAGNRSDAGGSAGKGSRDSKRPSSKAAKAAKGAKGITGAEGRGQGGHKHVAAFPSGEGVAISELRKDKVRKNGTLLLVLAED